MGSGNAYPPVGPLARCALYIYMVSSLLIPAVVALNVLLISPARIILDYS